MIFHVKRNVSQTGRKTTKMTLVFTIQRVALFVKRDFGGSVGGKMALIAFERRIQTLQLILKILSSFVIVTNVHILLNIIPHL